MAECLCRVMAPNGPESAYISDRHCPIHTKQPKLKCGCRVGVDLCPQGEKLAEAIIDCYREMDLAHSEEDKLKVYKQYKERKAALGKHFKEQE